MESGNRIEAAGSLEERARKNAGQLLSYLVELYLPEGSSTISEGKLAELVSSAFTVLGLDSCTDEERLAVLAEGSVTERFQTGRHMLDEEAHRLAEEAETLDGRLKRLPCQSLHEDLAALGALPQTYDTYFQAHMLPHVLAYEPYGYQDEGRPGLSEAEAWLSCLAEEASWLESLGRKELPELLHEAAPGYEEGTASLRFLVEQHLAWLVPGRREDG
ncbi:MAG: DUF6179 domain-containing protein [Atopobiaceae bacterium]